MTVHPKTVKGNPTGCILMAAPTTGLAGQEEKAGWHWYRKAFSGNMEGKGEGNCMDGAHQAAYTPAEPFFG